MSGFVYLCNYTKTIKEKQPLLKEMLSLTRYQRKKPYQERIEDHELFATRDLRMSDCFLKGKQYSMILFGEIFNREELKEDLIQKGYTFSHDDEVLLASYDYYQEDCLNLWEGNFSVIISEGNKVFIARDPLGIKPLYYSLKEDTLMVSNEIKTILYTFDKVIVNQEGVKELLGLGPSCSPGKTIYKDILSLRPGHFMIYDGNITLKRYWIPTDKKHEDDLENSIEHVRELVVESVQKQIKNTPHLSSMLSGGLDSSIITAIASKSSSCLSTYSLNYHEQDKYFKAYDYQTTMDDDYIKDMLERYPTDHKTIVLSQKDLLDHLEIALIARDMPGMADIDSSFYLFSKEISKDHSISLSGECADEIFGGYPWFYKKELYEKPHFPWMRELDLKMNLFHKDIQKLNIKEYIYHQYQTTLNEINTTDFKKQMMYLNLEWFMQTLLTRCESQTLVSSLNVYVPFASKKIYEYIYNLPYEYMFLNHEEKGILRQAFEKELPEKVVHRKKNPFPKTHHPNYTKLVVERLKESLQDENNILYRLFDHQALFDLIESKGESFKVPWFGQLMMGPQLLAYLYQIALWGKLYHIELDLS